MKKILVKIVIAGILILIPSLVCYASGPGTTAADFLKIGVGARAAAMGEAFTALADDGTALYWNPAGLAQIEKTEISAMYNRHFQAINQGYLSLAFPSLGGTTGLGINYVGMGQIEGRDEYGNPTGNFGASDTHIFAGYANKFKNISWGLTSGWLRDKIEQDIKSSFLGSIGLLYFPNKRFTLGVVAQNIGTKLGSDPLPFAFKVGVALKLKNLTLVADMPWNIEYYGLGVEWWIGNILALRAGYKATQTMATMTGGIGLKFERIHLDYAYVPYGEIGSTHRISLRIKF